MRLILIAVLTAFTTSAMAAEVGRFQFNNRTVILESDRTWKFADEVEDASGADCTALSSTIFPVKFCLKDDDWRRDTADEPFEMLFASKKTDLYFGVIAERVYFDTETLRQSIVENAEGAAGLKGLTKTEHVPKDVNGHEWSVTELHLEIGATPFVFQNYNTSLKDIGSVQLMFWSGASIFPETETLRDAVSNSFVVVK